MKLNHKLSFHIPHVAYVNEGFVPIPLQKFEENLGNKFLSINIAGWHVISTTGYYKGREYPQDILTVFCSYEQQTSVIESFKATIAEMHEVMNQEAYAYEHDGVLIILNMK